MEKKIKLKVFSLGATTFIMILANTMLFPVLPQMKRILELTLREVSLMVLFISLTAALLSPIGGYLADIWGRKKVMIISIIIYGLAGGFAGLFIVLLEDPFSVVLFFRFIQGIGAAAPMFLALALTGDIFQSQERTRTMGIMEIFNGAGKLSGPIIGGTVAYFAWYAPFFIYPLLSFPVAFLLWKYIEEPPLREKVSFRTEMASCSHILELSKLLILIAGFLIILFIFGTMFWLGEFMERIMPDGTIIHGLVISLPVAAMMFTSIFSPRLAIKYGPRILIFSGLVIAGIALIFIAFLFQTIILWPAVILTGISAGLSLPAMDTIASAVSSRGHRGIITTIFGGFRALGIAAAPYLIATLMEISISAAFFPLAVIGIIFSIIILIFAKDEELLPPNLQPT